MKVSSNGRHEISQKLDGVRNGFGYDRFDGVAFVDVVEVRMSFKTVFASATCRKVVGLGN